MVEELFLGVDGGASHSSARIRDARGRCLGEGAAGPANAWLDAAAATREVIAASRAAAKAAGLGDVDLAKVHAGLGLAGVVREHERSRMLAQPYPFASIVVDTDAYAAYLGACGTGDGAILIVGTGSCGLAVIGGKRINVGGWGAIIADDGSGGAIGREALRRSLWALEGTAPMSGLARAVLEHFGRDPAKMADWAAEATPGDFARFAPTVFEWAERHDPLALALAAWAAADVGRMVERLLACGVPSVCLVGGIAGSIAPWLSPTLRDRLASPAADAMDGAILMARQAHRAARRA